MFRKISKFTAIGILAFYLLPFSVSAEEPKLIFNDIPSSSPYLTAVNDLYSSGILKGYEDKTFKGSNSINRAEFLKILMELKGFNGNGSYCFKDIKNQWFAPYICQASKKGFINGVKGYFRPEESITLADASKMIVNIMGYQSDLPKDKTATWYQPYVFVLEQKRAIPVSINSFSQKISRGEMAEIIWRLKNNITDHFSTTFENIKKIDEAGGETNPEFDKTYLELLIPTFIDQFNIKIQSAKKEIVGLDKKTVLEIKALARIRSAQLHQDSSRGISFLKINWSSPDFHYIEFPPQEDQITSSNLKNTPKKDPFLLYGNYKNVIFFTYDFGRQYFYFIGLDTDTFKFIGPPAIGFRLIFFKDKNYVYQLKNNQIFVLDEVDPASFEHFFTIQYDGAFSPAISLAQKWSLFAPIQFNSDTPYLLNLYKDKNHVYQSAGKELAVLNEIDPKTFEYVSFPLFKDKKSVYQFIDDELFPFDNVDSKSFEGHHLYGEVYPDLIYYTDKNSVYYLDKNNNLQVLEGSDPNTFKEIDEKYGFFTDKNQAYFYSDYSGLDGFTVIKGANIKTIKFTYPYDRFVTFVRDDQHIFALKENGYEAIPNFDLKNVEEVLPNIFKDDKKIYSFNIVTGEFRIFDDINTENFYNNNFIFSDGKSVFTLTEAGYSIIPIPGADPATIKYLDHDNEFTTILKDKNNVYYTNEKASSALKLAGADTQTFEVITDNYGLYAKDKNHVYSKLDSDKFYIVDSLDPKTIEFKQLMGFAYLKDKNAVYYFLNSKLILLKDADSSTFQVKLKAGAFDSYYLYDKKYVWKKNETSEKFQKLIGVDPKTFDFK